MVLLESLNIPLGTKAKDFTLPGIDGNQHSLNEYASSKVLCIIFMCNHCPYVQAVIERLIKLQKHFEEKGVQFIGINANESENYPEDSFEKMSEYADEWGLNFPYLRDENQKVAKAYKAQCTPDIFVFDHNRELVYHGRIDDNWKEEDQVMKHELKKAIQSILKRKTVSEEQNPSIGCSIKWKE